MNDGKAGKKLTDPESPAKLLDDLFRKTKATPCLYWLPLTEEQAATRAVLRVEIQKKRQGELAAREAERTKRMEEARMRRTSPARRVSYSDGQLCS